MWADVGLSIDIKGGDCGLSIAKIMAEIMDEIKRKLPNSNCYSIVELSTSWEKEHVELGNFILFPIWFRDCLVYK